MHFWAISNPNNIFPQFSKLIFTVSWQQTKDTAYKQALQQAGLEGAAVQGVEGGVERGVEGEAR